MIPGSNILKMAARVIKQTPVLYYEDNGRETNAAGYDVTSYKPARAISGSFQPIPQRLNQSRGLELQAQYADFYVQKDLIGIERDISGDQIKALGRRWQVLSSTPWYEIDGWAAVLCVAIEERP